jgi:hypothetical protein
VATDWARTPVLSNIAAATKRTRYIFDENINHLIEIAQLRIRTYVRPCVNLLRGLPPAKLNP